MIHRLTTLTGLAWLMSAVSFQGPIAVGTPTSSAGTTAATTAVMTATVPASTRPSARSPAWTWTSLGGKRQGSGLKGLERLEREGLVLSRPLRAEAAAAAPAPGGSEEGVASPKSSASSDTDMVAGENDDTRGPLKRAFGRVARLFGFGMKLPSIKELGLYAFLSYGFVSNTSYAICVCLAWFASSKKTGLSPLAPDQWQFFLVSYAAFFAINNVLRVPRFALSVSLAPAFDRLIAFLMKKTGRGKGVATVLCVILVNLMGTCTLMAAGILLASLLSGVPFWPAAA
eukprot:g14521.t1